MTNKERQKRRRDSGERVQLTGVTVPRELRDRMVELAHERETTASTLWEQAGKGILEEERC